MHEKITYDESREAWLVTGDDFDDTYLIAVPRDFVEDETGGPVTTKAGEAWVREHLAYILQAYLARAEGGWVKEPWNRVLVEVMD